MRPHNKNALCDIILVASDPYLYIFDTIDSLSRTIRNVPTNLMVVSNGIESFTHKQFDRHFRYFNSIEILNLDEALPYINAAMYGSTHGNADFLVTAPMGSLFPSGWLCQLLSVLEANKDIAAAKTLTNINDCNFTPALVPGVTVYEFSQLVQKISPRYLPNGFIIPWVPTIYRRPILESVRHFEIMNGKDLLPSLQELLIDSGYRVVLADDVYIHIRGIDRTQTNNKIVATRDEKKAIRKLINALTRKTRRVRSLSFSVLEHTIRAFIRGVVRPFARLGTREVISRTFEAVSMLPPKRILNSECAFFSGFRQRRNLNVVYILDRMVISGGALVVVEIVNELILLGINARIATLARYPETREWECLSEPLTFRSAEELITDLPRTDIAVATFWRTAPWVHQLATQRTELLPVYFLQDYEAWFYAESKKRTRHQVIETYNTIRNKIVTTGWLAERLAEHGQDTTVIPIGVDIEGFHPRKRFFTDKVKILAMARPSTPHRGFETVIETMSLVIRRIPKAQVILFGEENLASKHIPFPFINIGVVRDRKQMALLYAEADVYFDGSYFQGFGRPALEAMASGLPCVLTSVGGVNEYAQDGKNALLVPPRNPDRAAEAICDLIINRTRRQHIARAGRATALHFSNREIARRTLDFFLRNLRNEASKKK